MELNWNSIIITILVILLLGAVGYFGYEKSGEYINKKQVEGYSIGYQQAVIDMYNEAVQCKTIPLTFQNQTITMVAGECLQNGN